MKHRFPIFGFNRRSILPMPEAGINVSPHRYETESRNAGNGRTEPVPPSLGRILAILAIIALLIGGGLYYHGQRTVSVPPMAALTPGDSISREQLEAQYGIRITLIAVTGGGGIIDFRYRIVDPQKATPLLHDPANTPVLTVTGTGLTLAPTKMSRHHSEMSMKRNAVPFIFYPNVRNAVKPGTPVSVAFGKIRVEPIVAAQ